ncbi:uridine kinase [Pseudomonas helleri]|uniref:Phosphoribulokinase n=1 Tax=Pseudomonas helleri TaxID=1608996 RepID=A0A7X1XF12_9PSED|nr:uridine kinase [Pseudomonas helleri]MQT90327.1 uridine kinase [Pseudomonas helleri]
MNIKFFCRPTFLIGLALRLLLVLWVAPAPLTEWYLPFLDTSTGTLTLNPWATWLEQGGAITAFPYGYIMWAAFLPSILLCKVLSLPLILGYGLTLVGADFLLLAVLRKLVPNQDRLLVAVYWLSPIIIVGSYVLGYNDLIPVLLLAWSLYFLKSARLMLAGLVFITAISAKLSMILALPFILIYLQHNRSLRQYLPRLLAGLTLGAITTILPFLLSSAGVSMLYNNPEIGKIYNLAFTISDTTRLYVVPLAYLLMIYAAWRIKRPNFELFHAMLGMVFLLVVLMTPASPGWFIWAIPPLVAYQVASNRMAVVITWIFSLLYVVSALLITPDVELIIGQASWLPQAASQWLLSGKLSSLVHTTMVATGVVLAIRIWRESVSRNDYFRLSRKPFVIGVAGDSGAGKDTYSDAIKGLFGGHSVTTLSGDDYHLWDRQKPMWQVMTHLNPMANDLEGFAHDLVSLTDSKNIHSRHYDHKTGRMSRPFMIKSNDFIIASGLHALYLPILRECYNLSVYLDIDESLRRHFKLQRDVHQRGHSEEKVLSSFTRREPDSARFIRPQAAHADLVLSLQPIHPRMLEGAARNHPLHFKIVARSRNGLNELSLTRVLVGVCGLHVDMSATNDASEVELTIEGETSAHDIEMAARMICPRVFDFLDLKPEWQDGVMGLMQLITLSHINQALTKRFI